MKRSQKILIIALVLGIAVLTVLALTRNPNTGTLRLDLTPKDAVVTIDDKQVKGTRHKLAPGAHDISVKKDGYLSQGKSVIVKEGEVTNFSVELVQKTPENLVSNIFRENIYKNITAPDTRILAAKSLYSGFWIVGAIEIGGEEVRTVILQKDQSDKGYSLYLVGPPFNPSTVLQLPEDIQALINNDDWIEQ